MVASNFEPVMEGLLKDLEGGYVNHPKDPGGETNHGITKRSYPKLNIRTLTWPQAKRIYKVDFWDKVKGDLLPSGVDAVTVDPAINSGPRKAAQWLQAAAGVKVDGLIGIETLQAVRAADPVVIIKGVSARRLGFMRSLTIWSSFGRGWSKRVAKVEAVALSMATPAKVLTLPAASREAQRKAKEYASNAVLSTGTVGGSATVVPTEALYFLVPALILLVVILLGKRLHQQNRVEALTKEMRNA